jgi:hypothetical protein
MRSISPSLLVAPPAGAKVRTRLHLMGTDEELLLQVGAYLARLAGRDLAARCRVGPGPDGRARRKRELTAACSSRWAGAITRTTNDQWTRGYKNLPEERASLRQAIRQLEQRVRVPVSGKAGRVRVTRRPQSDGQSSAAYRCWPPGWPGSKRGWYQAE